MYLTYVFLRPLQIDEILDSVKKTGNLVIIDTGYKTYGIGAEIVSQLRRSGIKVYSS